MCIFKEDKLHLTSAGRLFQIELPLKVKVRFPGFMLRSGYSHRRGANKDFFLLIRTAAVKHTNNALMHSAMQAKLLE